MHRKAMPRQADGRKKAGMMAVIDRSKFFEKAKAGVKKAFQKRDIQLIQAVRCMDDLDSAKSLMYTRLMEWFKLNFPEFDLANEETACAIIAEFGAKELFSEQKLAEIVGAPKAKELMQKAQDSYGAEFTADDQKTVKKLAEGVLSLFTARKNVEEFVQKEGQTTLRNLSYLTDPLLAARLVTIAGGLARLAKMPGSTIQVIGAEKALFKHLRKGTKPPKHGILFQSPLVRGSPLEERGRIARTLAAKLTIAAKADYFTGNFIAEKLKEGLDKRLKEIKAG